MKNIQNNNHADGGMWGWWMRNRKVSGGHVFREQNYRPLVSVIHEISISREVNPVIKWGRSRSIPREIFNHFFILVTPDILQENTIQVGGVGQPFIFNFDPDIKPFDHWASHADLCCLKSTISIACNVCNQGNFGYKMWIELNKKIKWFIVEALNL